MPRGVLEEMTELLDEERPHMLVTEVRRLCREVDLELPAGADIEQAIIVAETFVDSEDFEQLDEGVREAWRWVLKKMWKVTKGVAKAKAAIFIAPAIIGPAAFLKGTAWGTKKVLKALTKGNQGPQGGSGELLRGDEPFTIGDVTFHPRSANMWRAVLPGRYEVLVKHRPNQGTFQLSLEGQPVGGHWDEDDLGYALQMAVAMTVEPEEDEGDPRLGRL